MSITSLVHTIRPVFNHYNYIMMYGVSALDGADVNPGQYTDTADQLIRFSIIMSK